MVRPVINVTPLIDVLLVLLIIFMCVAPLKPTSFHAKIPAEQRSPPQEKIDPNPKTLAVLISADHALALNQERGLGTTDDASRLVDRLKGVFAERVANGDVSESFADAADRPFPDKAERTVFIKAPRSLDYGSVAQVVDAVKLAGAYPISLQIDSLE
jgi:biopolymer transport protein ExbD